MMQLDRKNTLSEITFWPALAAILIGLYLVTAYSMPDLLENSLLPASLVLVVRFLVFRSILTKLQSTTSLPQQRFWRFLGTGLLLWLLADMSWLIQRLYSGTAPGMPSVSQWLLMSGYFAIVASVFTHPRSRAHEDGLFREVLDVNLILLSLLSLTWLTMLKPSLFHTSVSLADFFWSYLTPFLDVFLLVLFTRLILIRSLAETPRLTLLLAGAFLLLGVVDALDAYRFVVRAPGPSSIVWVGRMTALVFVGLTSRQTVSMPVNESVERSYGWSRWASLVNYLLPMAFMLSAMSIIFLDWWGSREPDWFGVASAGLLALLMFARQGTIMGQQEMRRFKALVNATKDVAFICSEDGLLRMANPALEVLLGSSFDEGQDLPLSRFMAFNVEEGWDADNALQAALEGGWDGEADLIRSDGTRFPALVSLSPFANVRWGGLLLAGTAHDLSPIRDREDRLRDALDEVDQARNELAELNAELELKVRDRTDELKQTIDDLARLNEELKTLDNLKNEFVALVSHELRSPLTNIRSGIELVLDGQPDLEAGTQRSLQLVQAEIHRLMYLVETILDLSALEAGGFNFEMLPLSVEACARAACDRLQHEDDLERININIAGRLCDVYADERALASIFFHLLDNSLKYAPEGEIEITAWEEKDRVFIALRDHGPGIPAEERERVFDMFHRLDASDAREVYGHGLGLPMVRRFIEAMEGGVEIDAEIIEGTRVILWLQRVEAT